LDLARSTLCAWVGVVAQKLRPLHELLVQRVFLSHLVQTDATTIPVQDPESGKTRTSRMWVYLGDKNHRATVYDYTPSRARHGPEAFLGAFEGYLQADAYRNGSPIHFAKQLKGNLLIVHGTGDDNCHFHGVETLIDELIVHNKTFTMMAYPNRSHSINEGRNTTRHLYETLTRYLRVHVAP
jgi:dipeptidyl aminopeptidase/acylaminoacyl peptidase